MKRLKPKKSKEIKIFNLNIIAFVVIFVILLIICMLSKPAIFGKVPLELPRGEAEIIIVKQNPIIVSVKRNEEIFIGDESIKLKDLPQKILELSNNTLDVKIFVKVDKELKYKNVIKVVSRINSIGFSDVSLMIDVSKNL